ncbi:hypothetical protein HK405_012217 [Cladochytrium tenue]|nr:hypothetical protein HK405_012217 [Cladochytrium tenue]
MAATAVASAATTAATTTAAAGPSAAAAAVLRNLYPIRTLQRNLRSGLGAGVSLPPSVTGVSLIVGGAHCPSRLAAATLCVNELPRLHAANPSVRFATAEEPGSVCRLILSMSDGSSKPVDLAGASTPSVIYAKLMQEAGMS